VCCVNINGKKKALKGGPYSKYATQSDELFAFLLKFYKTIPPGSIRGTTPKKKKLAGERMEAAVEFFDNTMKEMKMMKLTKEYKIKFLDFELKTYIGSKTGGFCNNDDSTMGAT